MVGRITITIIIMMMMILFCELFLIIARHVKVAECVKMNTTNVVLYKRQLFNDSNNNKLLKVCIFMTNPGVFFFKLEKLYIYTLLRPIVLCVLYGLFTINEKLKNQLERSSEIIIILAEYVKKNAITLSEYWLTLRQ